MKHVLNLYWRGLRGALYTVVRSNYFFIAHLSWLGRDTLYNCPKKNETLSFLMLYQLPKPFK